MVWPPDEEDDWRFLPGGLGDGARAIRIPVLVGGQFSTVEFMRRIWRAGVFASVHAILSEHLGERAVLGPVGDAPPRPTRRFVWPCGAVGEAAPGPAFRDDCPEVESLSWEPPAWAIAAVGDGVARFDGCVVPLGAGEPSKALG
jgi:hypothetical protein